MPLNCPRFTLAYESFFSKYNACLECRHRHGNECWASLQVSRKISDILTIEERISILEDRREVPPVNIVTMTHNDYQQLQRLIMIIKEKEEKLELTIKKYFEDKPKKKYNKYD